MSWPGSRQDNGRVSFVMLLFLFSSQFNSTISKRLDE